MSERGFLSIVLHAHLPFVRHPEHERFLEEDWLFEAIVETYLPLIEVLDGLDKDGIKETITLSLSPTLISMLDDDLLRERTSAHFDRLVRLAEAETIRTKSDPPPFRSLAHFYKDRIERMRALYGDIDRDIAGAFDRLADRGQLHLITCAATHGFLPLLDEPSAVKAQVFVARDQYTERFGRPPAGIWLPECAFRPGLDRVLADAGIEFFFLDTHGITNASPSPRGAHYTPIRTPAGPVAFGRDPESSESVWSSEVGYPGDPVYRDFYRDVGFDREEDYIRPFIHPDGIRCFTGIKYHAVTGDTDEKKPYDPRAAMEQACIHAKHFVSSRIARLESEGRSMDSPPIITAPFDAELFGHWWFEGPEFLGQVLREAAQCQDRIRVTDPASYLDTTPSIPAGIPPECSWGAGGHWAVWLNEKNDWIYPHLERTGRAMEAAVHSHPDPDPWSHRVLRQMGRELMLAQASDWPFILNAGTAVDYANQRIHSHVDRFEQLLSMLDEASQNDKALASMEATDNLFPSLDIQHWS